MGEGVCWSVVCTELHEDYVLESRVIHRAMNNPQGGEWRRWSRSPRDSVVGIGHSGALRAQRGALRTHRAAWGRAQDAENRAEGAGAAQSAHKAALRTQKNVLKA